MPHRTPAAPRRRITAALALAAVVAGVLSWPGETAATAAAASSGFTEVGRLPVLYEGEGDVGKSAGDQSGWLILSRKTRRAYQVFETSMNVTVVQSFDLDTMAPRRRAVLSGYPVASGRAATQNAGGTSGTAGEIVHAVDEEAGRIYLALAGGNLDFPGRAVAFFSGSPDATRPVDRYVAIDEAAFDAGKPAFAASFPEPFEGAVWVQGLGVDRIHGAPSGFGRLVAIQTTPPPSVITGVHRLVQWDVSDLELSEGAAAGVTAPDVLPDPNREIPLPACAGGSMVTGGSLLGLYQWGLLVRPEGFWLGCQKEANSGRAVFAETDGEGRATAAPQQAYQLSRAVSDVLVDEGSGRLLFRTYTGGMTLWVFDTRLRRFTGNISLALIDGAPRSLGIDDRTGRLYLLAPDYAVDDMKSGRPIPVRGGLLSADTRLAPVPQAENRDPSLAYPAAHRIRVDTATRRVFVRRGNLNGNTRVVYPGTDSTTPAPVEDHYLVLRDDRPIPEQVAEGAEADRRFTANVAERDGLTKASYLGSASGYGTRTLLVGGLAAATARNVANGLVPGCDKDDREVVAAQVEATTLSDVSAAASAAALAGDSKTEEQVGRMVARCREELAPAPQPEAAGITFDADGDGSSDYRTQCTDDEDPGEVNPRDGFSADVDCHAPDEKVQAESTGAVAVAGSPVKVGWSHTETSVKRKSGGGVVATVDSVARDIEIDGRGRIGVVRSVATSEAAGRDGTARGSYRRWICGVDLTEPEMTTAGCLSEAEEDNLVTAMNTAGSGHMEARLRQPEKFLLAGSVSGYRAGVQRPDADRFQDRFITRDASLAIPGLELVFYRGDDPAAGSGRQIVQLAGAQAGTSYGIACLYGQGAKGCAGPGDSGGLDLGGDVDPPSSTVDDGGNLVAAPFAEDGTVPDAGTDGDTGDGGGGLLQRLLRVPARAAAAVWHLLLSSPGELALLAGVWALLWLPCYLADRRRLLARPLGGPA